MQQEYYAEYYEYENYNWWFVSRRRIICALLKKFLPLSSENRTILDAGCGTGINLAMLAEFGHVIGADSSEEAIKFCALRNEKEVRLAQLQELPFDSGSFDLVTALDVLEHIEDDYKAVAELARVCKIGGNVLITVPVFPWLWCEHDEINHHVRRYEPKRINALLEQNGLSVVHRSYMNSFLLPVALVWRWRKQFMRFFSSDPDIARADNMHHNPWINMLLTAIFSFEKPFVKSVGLPIGLSLVILVRKVK